jgi:hypothetical protein
MRRVALCCALVLAACAGVPKPAQPYTDARRALELHRLVREQVPAIRAEARVEQRGDRGRIKGTVFLLVQRPARVRFDVMTQFGPVAVLTSDGERFAFSDLRSKRFLTGATCPKNIARLLNVSLTAEQTVLLLLGGTPILEHARSSVTWDDDGFYRLVLHAATGERQEVDLGIPEADLDEPPERQHLVLLRSEIFDKKGRSNWRAVYEEYERLTTGGIKTDLPYVVHVTQATAGTETRIRFKEVSVDTELPGDAFVQAPAPGMVIEEASCE